MGEVIDGYGGDRDLEYSVFSDQTGGFISLTRGIDGEDILVEVGSDGDGACFMIRSKEMLEGIISALSEYGNRLAGKRGHQW
ncbi:MAG TPA: hypothetical protein VNQ99_12340 [Xanthobacteraceae bacterium]|nr:hypothetical protein [Xanthobacteraceae bacterium]